jgi:hypothetical protein
MQLPFQNKLLTKKKGKKTVNKNPVSKPAISAF